MLLAGAEKTKLLTPLLSAGWALGNYASGASKAEHISKTYTFESFVDAFSYMTRVALAAEKMDHHPDWSNVYNRLTIIWSTHDCNGLSEKDIKMALFCDSAFSQLTNK